MRAIGELAIPESRRHCDVVFSIVWGYIETIGSILGYNPKTFPGRSQGRFGLRRAPCLFSETAMIHTGISRWLVGMLRPYSAQITGGIIVATCVGALATVDPLLMRQLIDASLPMRSLWLTGMDVALIALCFIGRSALGGISSLLSFRVSQHMAQDLRAMLLVHMTNLSADWHEKTLLGQKVARIEQDVEQIAQYGSDVASTIFRALVFFLVNLSIMMFLNWRMTASVLPLLPLFFWVRLRFRNRIQARADRAQAEIGNAAATLTEHLGAVPQIQLLGAEDASVAKTVEGWLEALSARTEQRKIEILFSVAVTSVLAAGILFVLGLGAHEYFIGALSIGGLVAFYAYVTRIFEPVSSAMELYARTERMLASARRVREVLDTKSSVSDTGTLRITERPLSFGLSCERVSFGYRPEDIKVKNISLELRRSECIALVGKSGSGKSTLSRLLARLADPISGRILLENQPLTEFALSDLRRAISYVPQQPVLFSGSIRENLLCANREASRAELESAIRAVQLDQVLIRLPAGMDTMLGGDATGISGGERQRLAIGRALLRRPEILILDESTSALDLPTESALFRTIANSCESMAMILISHRLRSLTWVDRILVLDAGRIVASGTHAELYESSAMYRELYDQGDPDSSASALPPIPVTTGSTS